MEVKTIYTNSEGKSLDEVATLFNISVSDLELLNPTISENIVIGVSTVDDIEEVTAGSRILDAVATLPKDKQEAVLKIIESLS